MSKTVLTVDDASTMRRMIALTVRGIGHDVLEAKDGLDALRVLKDRNVDLIITDVNMPNLDGIELTRRIRNLPHYKRTPILILTTETEESKKAQGKQAGATGWINKPFLQNQLVAVVNKVLVR